MSDSVDLAARVDAMRRAFDGGFALPLADPAGDVEDLLAIRVGSDPYAIRVREIVAISALRRVVEVPSRARGLIGLIGLRGQVVPVFSLAALLGAPGGTPRWIALCPGDPLAVAFDTLEGHRRIARREVREIVMIDGGLRPVVDMAALAASLRHEEQT